MVVSMVSGRESEQELEESYDATIMIELRMKFKEIVHLGIYSVYLEIYFWPKVYLRIYGVQLLAV
jgi:hypothetical protein